MVKSDNSDNNTPKTQRLVLKRKEFRSYASSKKVRMSDANLKRVGDCLLDLVIRNPRMIDCEVESYAHRATVDRRVCEVNQWPRLQKDSSDLVMKNVSYRANQFLDVISTIAAPGESVKCVHEDLVMNCLEAMELLINDSNSGSLVELHPRRAQKKRVPKEKQEKPQKSETQETENQETQETQEEDPIEESVDESVDESIEESVDE